MHHLNNSDMETWALSIMTQPVIKLKENDSIGNALDKLIKYQISSLPIVNDHNEIIGFVSDGDILRRIGKHNSKVIDTGYFMLNLAEHREPFESRCDYIRHENIMKVAKRKVIKVQWNSDIEQVSAIIAQKKLKKVPVERNGVLIGIISRRDIIRHLYAGKQA